MSISIIGDALFTKTQQRVLGLLYGTPDQRFFTNEIFRRTAIGRGTVIRELEKLVSADLVSVTTSGNQRYYQANRKNPVYSELSGIVRKTFGVADCIREALKTVLPKVALAFVYGSIAKNTDDSNSDLDVMLVGDELEYGEIMDLLVPLEAQLQRTINPTIYEFRECEEKLALGSSFLERVLEQPTLMIKGSINDIGKPGSHNHIGKISD